MRYLLLLRELNYQVLNIDLNFRQYQLDHFDIPEKYNIVLKILPHWDSHPK